MKTELQKHKSSDKVKWIISFTLILVILVGLAGVCIKLFVPKKTDDAPKVEVPKEEITCTHEFTYGVCDKCKIICEHIDEDENSVCDSCGITSYSKTALNGFAARATSYSTSLYSVPVTLKYGSEIVIRGDQIANVTNLWNSLNCSLLGYAGTLSKGTAVVRSDNYCMFTGTAFNAEYSSVYSGVKTDGSYFVVWDDMKTIVADCSFIVRLMWLTENAVTVSMQFDSKIGTYTCDYQIQISDTEVDKISISLGGEQSGFILRNYSYGEYEMPTAEDTEIGQAD